MDTQEWTFPRHRQYLADDKEWQQLKQKAQHRKLTQTPPKTWCEG
jgi:hypothetical protein